MADLPSGTVTFLFTDIEGSTTRWEHQPEAMAPALARHDALLRSVIHEHGGAIVKTVGDAFHAAFTRAPEALAAALDAQRRLQAEPWGEIGALRVRVALHTGAAEERDGDYFGPPLNRAARLLSTGHGGQVLLSQATYELVRDALPNATALVDLGEHRLKDLIRPERVFQLVGPDLPADFPPLRTLDARPNNLPLQTTPLLGRECDVASVRQRLLRDDVRLLTLTGPGGTGKTRFSLQVAAELIDEFDDGVFFVALAPISDPELVAPTIGQMLGMQDLGNRPVVESLKEYLRDRQTLLVLDNFEQVLAAAPTVGALLGASQRLKVLVTSRAPLELRGEQEFPVPPLALPDPKRLPSIGALGQYAAVALFIERATAIRPAFSITNENAPAVAAICIRLDGLPLAIELAAARIRSLPPQAMLTRLERRLPLLTGGARDLPARQQTLRGAIAWSHDLLDDRERVLFRRLAIFVGGCTLEAAEAMCDVGGDLGADVLDGMTSLVAKSLVLQEEGSGGEPRFGMLETIREYAMEQLDASGEAPVLRDRHLDYFLAFAVAANTRLRGPQQIAWFDRLERENDNLRAALERSYAVEGPEATDAGSLAGAGGDVDRVEKGIRLAASLTFFWVLRGRARENLARVMALLERAPTGLAAQARALTVAAQVGGHMLGDYQMALPLADEGLRQWRALGAAQGIAPALMIRGQLAHYTGEYSLAMTLFAEARTLFREVGGPGPVVPMAALMAEVAHAQGDHDQARLLLDEALVESRARGDTHALAAVLRELARLRRTQGGIDEAARLLRESLSLLQPLKDVRCAQLCLEELAGVLSEQGRATDAAHLFGASETLGEMIGKPLTQAQLTTHDHDVAAVQRRLDAKGLPSNNSPNVMAL